MKELIPFVVVHKNHFINIDSVFDFFKNKRLDDKSSYIEEWSKEVYFDGTVKYTCCFNYNYKVTRNTKLENSDQEEIIINDILQARKESLIKYIDAYKNEKIWNDKLYNIDYETFLDRTGIDVYCIEPVNRESEVVYASCFHSDRNMQGIDQEQHIITTMMYLNDDYDNGEIEFFHEDNGIKRIVSYKPEKGDIITFPSFVPFFHAVRVPYGKDRYTIRTSWNGIFNDVVEINSFNFKEYMDKKMDILDATNENMKDKVDEYIYIDGKDFR